MAKIIIGQYEWDKVYQELENEVIKTTTYDDFVINLMGKVNKKKILDYGSGPGVIAKALQNIGASVARPNGIGVEYKFFHTANRVRKQNINVRVVSLGESSI